MQERGSLGLLIIFGFYTYFTFFLLPFNLDNGKSIDVYVINDIKSTDNEDISSTERICRYYERPVEVDFLSFKGDDMNNGYITFEDDTGGWNNIRIAFEVFVTMAWLTGRTLVLPPPARFYLLDRGPIALFDKGERRTYSLYSQYYDIDKLKEQINIISTEEFLKKEPKLATTMSQVVSSEVYGVINGNIQPFGNGKHTEYLLWLRNHPLTEIWPSGPIVTSEFNPLKPKLKSETKILHFPMHVSQNLRYLNGVDSLLKQIKNKQVSSAVKKLLREYLVYSDSIFSKAISLVEKMGGVGTYSSIHIRRNELQYKQVFLEASSSLNNIQPALETAEAIYIATDETEPGFFRAFTERGYTVTRMHDLKQLYPDEFIDFLPKYEGMLEQLICALGREFFATPSSTFSSYILRLRGYIWGKSLCRFHTKHQTKDGEKVCHTHFEGDMSLWKIT